jgi:hypothetical protein
MRYLTLSPKFGVPPTRTLFKLRSALEASGVLVVLELLPDVGSLVLELMIAVLLVLEVV